MWCSQDEIVQNRAENTCCPMGMRNSRPRKNGCFFPGAAALNNDTGSVSSSSLQRGLDERVWVELLLPVTLGRGLRAAREGQMEMLGSSGSSRRSAQQEWSFEKTVALSVCRREGGRSTCDWREYAETRDSSCNKGRSNRTESRSGKGRT